MSSGSAAPAPPVPAAVDALAAGDALALVWINELGGLTYEIGAEETRRFVKWAPAASGLDLFAEAERLSWAVEFTPVPRVLAQGADPDGSWIVTDPLPGRSAIDPRWKAAPATAVAAIGAGLRAMHDSLPVATCPFSWQAEERLADLHRRAALGLVDPSDEALRLLADVPPLDALVVCHGDTCAPNTLLDDSGQWCGHVDLGELGVADRWADLAVATWSTTWNYGPGWEEPLLAAYGVEPDPARTRYYRLLWELGP